MQSSCLPSAQSLFGDGVYWLIFEFLIPSIFDGSVTECDPHILRGGGLPSADLMNQMLTAAYRSPDVTDLFKCAAEAPAHGEGGVLTGFGPGNYFALQGLRKKGLDTCCKGLQTPKV